MEVVGDSLDQGEVLMVQTEVNSRYVPKWNFSQEMFLAVGSQLVRMAQLGRGFAQQKKNKVLSRLQGTKKLVTGTENNPEYGFI